VITPLRNQAVRALGVGLLTLAVATPGLGCGGEPPAESTPAPNSDSPALEARFKQVLRDKEARPRPEPVDEMRTAMETYRAQYDADPTGPEAPILLNAMANLAQQRFGDDVRAIQYYEILVLNFPDWEGTPAVYPLLAAAYDRTERFEDARWLHEQMMKRFPPTSPEFQFARERLGLKPLPEETAPPLDAVEGELETPPALEAPEAQQTPTAFPVPQAAGATGS
jgi:hypothetical protein